MPMPILTLYNLMLFNDTLFDQIQLPEGADRQLLVDRIMLDYGEMQLVYPDWSVMRYYSNSWFAAHLPNFQRLWDDYTAEYNPIHNKDAWIEESRTSSGSDTVTHGERVEEISNEDGSSSTAASGTGTRRDIGTVSSSGNEARTGESDGRKTGSSSGSTNDTAQGSDDLTHGEQITSGKTVTDSTQYGKTVTERPGAITTESGQDDHQVMGFDSSAFEDASRDKPGKIVTLSGQNVQTQGGTDTRSITESGSDTHSGTDRRSTSEQRAGQNSGTTAEQISNSTSDSSITYGESITNAASSTNDQRSEARADNRSRTGSVQHSGTDTTDRSGNENYSRREYGNIGVTTTQQMLEADFSLWQRINWYEIVAKLFAIDFMVMVY